MGIAAIVAEARKLKASRRFDEAQRLLESALAEEPGAPELTASLADLHVRQERFGEAETLADRLLNTRPGDARALTVKGNVAMAESRFPDAERFFQDALR